MKIDHSAYLMIDYLADSKSYGAIPYVYAYQHLALAVNTTLDVNVIERICHLVFGILLLIPVLNIFLAWADRTVCQMKQNLIIEFSESDPYQRGLKHGQMLRSEIQFIYYQQIAPYIRILNSATGKDCYLESKKLERQLSPANLEEMRGLAKGSNIPYDLVLQAHTFIDVFSAAFGCSSIGLIFNQKRPRVIATNHFESLSNSAVPSSRKRYDILQSATVKDETSLPNLLQKVDVNTTVQSIIFQCHDRKVLLATNSHNAAKKELKTVSLSSNFSDQIDASASPTYLARTLDWPMPALGNHTVTFVTNTGANKTVSIGFPGFIGILSGMNSKGVALSLSVSGKSYQDDGIPKALLLREALEQSHDAQSASTFLHSRKAASSFNVVLASPGQIASVEIDPSRASTGIAYRVVSGFVNPKPSAVPSLFKRITAFLGFS